MAKRVDSLEINEDRPHEKCFWRVERAAWAIWFLVLLAALAGLLGPGPLSKKVRSDSDQRLRVEYNRFDRYQSPATLKIDVRPDVAEDNEIKLALNRTFIEAIELRRIDPEPDSTETDGESIVYIFKTPDLKQVAKIIFHYEGNKSGNVPVRVSVPKGPEVHFSQFFYP
jgi:hypothetical protein